MLIFVVPAWHPTEAKPTWSSWIIPHIEMTKELGEVVVLQVDQDAENGQLKTISHKANHYYMPASIRKNRWTRTRLGYGKVLEEYSNDLEKLFEEAIEKYGFPDIIHAHVSMPAGYGSALLGEKYKIPVVVTEHYSGFFSDVRFPWRIEKYYQQMRSRIDGFFVVSPGFKFNIEKLTSMQVSGVLPNPINVETFRPRTLKEKKNQKLRLITTGDVCERKGTDVLLNAISKLPASFQFELTIIGEEPTTHSSSWELLQHPKVKLLPRKKQDELASCYSEADVFIVSSRVETANVSMLEAMACGCYVISSKIGAPESLLDDTVASFFTSEDVNELFQCIIDVPKFERDIQRKYVVDNYSKASVLTQLNDVYKEMKSKRKSRVL